MHQWRSGLRGMTGHSGGTAREPRQIEECCALGNLELFATQTSNSPRVQIEYRFQLNLEAMVPRRRSAAQLWAIAPKKYGTLAAWQHSSVYAGLVWLVECRVSAGSMCPMKDQTAIIAATGAAVVVALFVVFASASEQSSADQPKTYQSAGSAADAAISKSDAERIDVDGSKN